jgi:glycerophosphoryl diester phosphodiesterase
MFDAHSCNLQPTMNQLLIIAHRGGVPENTIAAMESAIALGADLVELDVRCTSDRVLIVHHNPKLQQQWVEDLTWIEVQRLQPEVPTLEAAIACCQGRIRMNVEVKEPGYEAEVVELLQAVPDAVVTSFYLAVLRAVREMNRAIELGFLMDHETLLALAEEEYLSQFLQAMKVKFVAPQMEILDSPLLEKLIPASFDYWVWTVNRATEMQDLIKNDRVKAIITDQPALGLQLRNGG